MDQFCDSEYLKKTQYKSADNLTVRIQLHQRFSTNPQDWQEWVFDKADLQAGQTVLELGGGPASFWKPNYHRLPEAVMPVLTDLSFGMVKTAKQIQVWQPRLYLSTVDSMRLPFIDNCFERVIANHTLYHVPDVATVLREAARVLTSNGRVIAATNGETHMQEIYTLLAHLLPEFFSSPRVIRRFNLENGEEQLRKKFHSVEKFIYEDSLQVTESPPLIAYIQSLWGDYLDQTYLKTLVNLIEFEIKDQGYFYVQKSTGVFIAADPKSP